MENGPQVREPAGRCLCAMRGEDPFGASCLPGATLPEPPARSHVVGAFTMRSLIQTLPLIIGRWTQAKHRLDRVEQHR